ncbi:MAG: hypothetical protein LBQ88_23590 [Treponema sp.]|jgi:hypothetical protein|nr:hypothetical protein [Treponema sp.]
MIRKPIFPRFISFFAVYIAVFIVLGIVQFTKQGGFTQRVGNMIVSGQYVLDDDGLPVPYPREDISLEGEAETVQRRQYYLTGEVVVYFGGMEFRMSGEEENNVFSLVKTDGQIVGVLPEYMKIEGESVLFYTRDGTELFFGSGTLNEKPALRISCNLSEDIEMLELPYRPQKTSRVRDFGDGQFIIIADGENYTFNRPQFDPMRPAVVFKKDSAALSYAAIPEQKAFSPEDYILPQAADAHLYKEAVDLWRDQNYGLWARLITRNTNEETVIAYLGEAVTRGNLKGAAASVAPAFINSPQRTYRSSVFLGGMETGQRTFLAAEQEKLVRVSQFISEKSTDFLREPHVFGFFAIRGYYNLMDEGTSIVHAIDPATMSAELIPAVFEGYLDWKYYRPNTENPFERLINQAFLIITEGLKRHNDGDKVFIFLGTRADIEFSMRLGKALSEYAGSAGLDSWAAVGRSLILSVLALEDSGGMIPAVFNLSEEGGISEDDTVPRVSAARIYLALAPGEYYSHAINIGAVVNGLWTWTAARDISVSQENNVLDISASFPIGETHYMIIRGLRPFVKMQLYNIDYRTDPQFERYDSSGWIYSTRDQILIVKMKHRAETEHIRVFY